MAKRRRALRRLFLLQPVPSPLRRTDLLLDSLPGVRGSLHWLLVGLALLQPAAVATAEDPPTDQAIGWLERYLAIDSSTILIG